MTSRPDYGIDAPKVVRNNLIAALACWAAAVAIFLIYRHSNASFASSAVSQGRVAGAFPMAIALVMLWSSKFGKFRVRDRLLGKITWHGSEQVLDIGCGRGLALIGAAKRLTSGHATGIDIWSQTDLSGNVADATWHNASAENVTDRISIETGDARALPFPDASFDIVLSMTAIHNIKDKAGRRLAIKEAMRVLKPGGEAAIFDIFGAGRYANWMIEGGMQDVKKSGPILLWLIPGRIVSARKKEALLF